MNGIREGNRGRARGDKGLCCTIHFPLESLKVVGPGISRMTPKCFCSLTRNSAGTTDLHALYLLCGFSYEHQLH